MGRFTRRLQATCERVSGGFTEVRDPHGRTPTAGEILHQTTEGAGGERQWYMIFDFNVTDSDLESFL